MIHRRHKIRLSIKRWGSYTSPNITHQNRETKQEAVKQQRYITSLIDAVMQSIIQAARRKEGAGSLLFTHPKLLGSVEVILVEVYEI